MIGFAAAVGAPENDVDRARLDADFFQKMADGYSGPFGMANGTGAPLHARDTRLQERSAIAGAFQRAEYSALAKSSQLVQGPFRDMVHASVQAQSPVSRNWRRHFEMIAHEKRRSRGHA